MANKSLIPFTENIAVGTTKLFLVAVTGHNKSNVIKAMELGTGNIIYSTIYKTTGNVVKHLTNNPVKVSKALKNVTKIFAK